MDNNFPFFPQNPMQPPLEENSLVSIAEDAEEAKRKELSYKRMTLLFVVLSLIILTFIVWEIVDLSLGGRP